MIFLLAVGPVGVQKFYPLICNWPDWQDRQLQFVAYLGAWLAGNCTLDVETTTTLGAKCGIFGMWRSLLTYGLLTLTITGLTLFNTMT